VGILPSSVLTVPVLSVNSTHTRYNSESTVMDDPWADTPSSTVIPPRPPKADRRSIPKPVSLESEIEVEEVKAEETKDESPEITDEPIQDEQEAPATQEEVEEDGFDDFGQNGNPVEPEGDGGFDDFDDFDAPAGPSAPGGEDGFGDFGDFEEGDFETNGTTNEIQEEVVPEVHARQWVSLSGEWGMSLMQSLR